MRYNYTASLSWNYLSGLLLIFLIPIIFLFLILRGGLSSPTEERD